jgi:hypothetical protein
MGLVDFLFRCPYCGADPLLSRGKTEAHCRECARSFRLARWGRAILVRDPAGETAVSPVSLGRALAARGGAVSTAEDDQGRLRREARVRIRVARTEAPVWYRGRLLGFFERFGPQEEGRLRLEGGRLSFRPEPEGPAGLAWRLDEIRALQSSSSSLQISPAEGGVVLFRFPEDSSRRWEELLAEALRRQWREAGRGEIVEFQPRIRAE